MVRDMTDPTPFPPDPQPHRSARRSSLLLRWTACVVVITGVFLASRLTTPTDPDDHIARDRPAGHSDPAPAKDPELGDVLPEDLEILEAIVEELLAPLDDLPGSEPTQPDPDGQWQTHTGTGLDGTRWSVQLPSTWTLDTIDHDGFIAHTPDQPRVATLISLPPDQDFDEAARSTAEGVMSDLVGVAEPTIAPIEHPDGDAYELRFIYTHPDGFHSAATVLILDTIDAYYFLSVESPLDDTAAQARAETILESFSATRPS